MLANLADKASVSRRKSWLNTIVCTLLITYGLTPLFILDLAPLADWPSHLARVWIEDKVLNGNEFWSTRYEYTGLFVPNAILDGVVLGFKRAGLSIELSGKLFLAICYFSFMLGFLFLARTKSIPSILSTAICLMLFYTGDVLFGLLNFVTGIGVCMFSLSLWIPDFVKTKRKILIAIAATPVILFCHIVPALIFAGFCICYDFCRHSPNARGRFINIIPGLMAFLIVILGYKLSPTGNNPVTIGYDGGPTIGGILVGKFRQAAEGLSSGSRIGDLITLAALTILAYCIWKRRIILKLSYLAPVIFIALLPILAPFAVGDGNLLDTRLFLVSLSFLVIFLYNLSGVSKRASIFFVGCATLKITALVILWASYRPIYNDLAARLSKLPVGSTLWSAYSDEPDFYLDRQPPLRNAATLAVKYGVFVPSTFAEATQHPLVIKPSWRPEWMWSHSANARSAQTSSAVHAKLKLFCQIERSSYLYNLHQTQSPRVTIENPCIAHLPAP